MSIAAAKDEGEERDVSVEREANPLRATAAEVTIDDDDDDEPGQGTPQTRDEKKKERGWYKRQLEQERAERQRDRDEFQRRFGELEGRLRQPPPQQQHEARGGEDQDRKELDEIHARNDALLAQFNTESDNGRKPLSPERQQYYRNKAYDLQEQQTELTLRRVARKNAPTPQQEYAEAERQYLHAHYGDVVTHERAANWWRPRFEQLVAEGKTRNTETLAIAMREARAKFRTNGSQVDEPVMRTKLRGVSSGGGGFAGSGGGGSKTYGISKAEMAMADKKYPNIKDDDERYEHYTKQIIIPARKKAEREGR